MKKRVFGATALALIALIWLGMVLGVSFLATSVKFMAPTLSLPTALDVGRHTFQAFVRVELAFYAATLLVIACFLRGGLTWVMAIALACVLGLEFAWLLPALDGRVGVILAGGAPAPSSLHETYIALEAVKVALLSVTGLWAVFALSADGLDPGAGRHC